MPCSVDSDCGNPFLARVSQMASMCRDPSVDAGSGPLSGDIPSNLPLCPTVALVTVKLCSVRYQVPCQIDSDCGPDGFTCIVGQCLAWRLSSARAEGVAGGGIAGLHADGEPFLA
jgi:hypothetical protein